MEIELNPGLIGEVLLGDEIRDACGAIANVAAGLAQAQVPKRTGALAGSIHGHTEIGGMKNDRWIGVVSMGGDAYYAASVEYGAGNHPGSTGRHHNPPAHVFDRVLEELDGL